MHTDMLQLELGMLEDGIQVRHLKESNHTDARSLQYMKATVWAGR